MSNFSIAPDGVPAHYCKHGTFIGDPYGPDLMCGWCESGEEPPAVPVLVFTAQFLSISKKGEPVDAVIAVEAFDHGKKNFSLEQGIRAAHADILALKAKGYVAARSCDDNTAIALNAILDTMGDQVAK